MLRIGIDLGGTKIAAGLVDKNYNIICKDSAYTNVERGAEAIVDSIAALCLKICKDNSVNPEELVSIGIASPGTVDCDRGVVEYANNLPFKRLHICEMLAERLGNKNVFAANDANAAAWGEALAGAAKGTKDSVMITLGTGVGGGIIIDNKIYTGFNYAGAELGHIVISYNGRQCSCGRKGCWEAYSSATALIAMTKEKIDECERYSIDTLMTDSVKRRGRVSGITAFECMREGDKAAMEVVDTYVRYLACGLVNIVNIFQPQIISIGGGISGEGESLIKMLEPYISADRYGLDTIEQTEIRIAALGNDAGIIGAAFLG